MPSTSTASQPWDVLRRNTRNLESAIDARLTTYSQLASKIARAADHTTLDMTGAGSSSASETREHSEHVELETELESLINELSNSVDALTAKLDDPAIPPTTPQLHAVQRHRELLFDFTRDFRRSQTNVRHAIDRRDLLGNVQGDIDAYKAAHASDADALLAERARIDNSHGMIDRTLEYVALPWSNPSPSDTHLHCPLSHHLTQTSIRNTCRLRRSTLHPPSHFHSNVFLRSPSSRPQLHHHAHR